MDKGTGPGIALGLGAMIMTMVLEGGNPLSLLNVPAAVIVFGGSLGAALVSTPMSVLLSLPKFLTQAFLEKTLEPHKVVDTFVGLADRARREGLLALEQEAQNLEPFAKKGVLMVVDGTDPALVREVMDTEIEAMEHRHGACYGMLNALGGFGPTFGIIGTVMGLINVLSHLEDPSKLGHSIAVAFIATLYGVASANILWLPLGAKLKHKSAEEVAVRELTVEGVLSVQAGDNPRVVRQKLEAKLSPAEREAAAKSERAGEPAAAVAG
jgi:chemotaxis protein MotA